jgi:hypothetical protein
MDRHQVEMTGPQDAFARCWSAAGRHLSTFGDGIVNSWLRSHLNPPFLEHLSFRLGNQLFFVRVEDEDGEQPDFVYTQVKGIDKLLYGIDINDYKRSKNIASICVTAPPWHDFGTIKQYPYAMTDFEKERILTLTERDDANHFYLMGEEDGWEETEIGFWLFGVIELSNACGELIDVLQPSM